MAPHQQPRQHDDFFDYCYSCGDDDDLPQQLRPPRASASSSSSSVPLIKIDGSGNASPPTPLRKQIVVGQLRRGASTGSAALERGGSSGSHTASFSERRASSGDIDRSNRRGSYNGGGHGGGQVSSSPRSPGGRNAGESAPGETKAGGSAPPNNNGNGSRHTYSYKPRRQQRQPRSPGGNDGNNGNGARRSENDSSGHGNSPSSVSLGGMAPQNVISAPNKNWPPPPPKRRGRRVSGSNNNNNEPPPTSSSSVSSAVTVKSSVSRWTREGSAKPVTSGAASVASGVVSVPSPAVSVTRASSSVNNASHDAVSVAGSSASVAGATSRANGGPPRRSRSFHGSIDDKRGGGRSGSLSKSGTMTAPDSLALLHSLAEQHIKEGKPKVAFSASHPVPPKDSSKPRPSKPGSGSDAGSKSVTSCAVSVTSLVPLDSKPRASKPVSRGSQPRRSKSFHGGSMDNKRGSGRSGSLSKSGTMTAPDSLALLHSLAEQHIKEGKPKVAFSSSHPVPSKDSSKSRPSKPGSGSDAGSKPVTSCAVSVTSLVPLDSKPRASKPGSGSAASSVSPEASPKTSAPHRPPSRSSSFHGKTRVPSSDPSRTGPTSQACRDAPNTVPSGSRPRSRSSSVDPNASSATTKGQQRPPSKFVESKGSVSSSADKVESKGSVSSSADKEEVSISRVNSVVNSIYDYLDDLDSKNARVREGRKNGAKAGGGRKEDRRRSSASNSGAPDQSNAGPLDTSSKSYSGSLDSSDKDSRLGGSSVGASARSSRMAESKSPAPGRGNSGSKVKLRLTRLDSSHDKDHATVNSNVSHASSRTAASRGRRRSSGVASTDNLEGSSSSLVGNHKRSKSRLGDSCSSLPLERLDSTASSTYSMHRKSSLDSSTISRKPRTNKSEHNFAASNPELLTRSPGSSSRRGRSVNRRSSTRKLIVSELNSSMTKITHKVRGMSVSRSRDCPSVDSARSRNSSTAHTSRSRSMAPEMDLQLGLKRLSSNASRDAASTKSTASLSMNEYSDCDNSTMLSAVRSYPAPPPGGPSKKRGAGLGDKVTGRRRGSSLSRRASRALSTDSDDDNEEEMTHGDSKASMVYDVPFDPLTGRCNYHPTVCMAVSQGRRDGVESGDAESMWKVVRTSCPKCTYNF